jgi:hypothetical protein
VAPEEHRLAEYRGGSAEMERVVKASPLDWTIGRRG